MREGVGLALFLQVLQSVAPVFVLALVGILWVRLGFEYRVEFVTRLAMTLSVPCLIFAALVNTEIDPKALRDTAAATLGAYGVISLVALIFVRVMRFDPRTYWPPLVFGNTGNLGLPVALFAFGNEGLGYAVVIFSIMAVMSFTIGLWVVSGGGSAAKAIKEPIVGATLLGGLFMVMGWRLPTWAMNTLELTGQMAIPLMLITLGVAITRLKLTAVGRGVFVSLVKLAICLAAGVGAGWALDLPPVAMGVLVMQVTTPVAVTSYMLAEKYSPHADEVAGLVVVSTLLSVVSIPLTLAAYI